MYTLSDDMSSLFFLKKKQGFNFWYITFLRQVMNILGSIWSCSNCLLHISYEKWKLCICLCELSSKQWSHLDTYVCKLWLWWLVSMQICWCLCCSYVSDVLTSFLFKVSWFHQMLLRCLSNPWFTTAEEFMFTMRVNLL